MRPVTWVDRIVDTSNKWLQAIRLEGGGQFSEAVVLFLEDAFTCLEKGEPARAALDCSCAADCMERMGAAASAKARDKFNLPRMIDQYERLHDDLIIADGRQKLVEGSYEGVVAK